MIIIIIYNNISKKYFGFGVLKQVGTTYRVPKFFSPKSLHPNCPSSVSTLQTGFELSELCIMYNFIRSYDAQ